MDALGIPHERIVYDTTGFTPANAHSIQNGSEINTNMLASWRAWLETHGVLP